MNMHAKADSFLSMYKLLDNIKKTAHISVQLRIGATLKANQINHKR